MSDSAAVTATRKRALNAGSSKHGKMRRASAASHCVNAYAQVAGAGGIETAQVAIERAGEAQAQRGGAGRQRPGSAQRHGLVVPIEDDAQRNHLAVDLGVGVLDREIRGVEDDLRSGARQADVDADLAPEATRREIGLEVDVVVARPHVGGEPEAGRMRGARHGHRV